MPKETSVRFRMDEDAKAQLQAAAERQGLTMTELVERALDAYLESITDPTHGWRIENRRLEREIAAAEAHLAQLRTQLGMVQLQLRSPPSKKGR